MNCSLNSTFEFNAVDAESFFCEERIRKIHNKGVSFGFILLLAFPSRPEWLPIARQSFSGADGIGQHAKVSIRTPDSGVRSIRTPNKEDSIRVGLLRLFGKTVGKRKNRSAYGSAHRRYTATKKAILTVVNLQV